MNPQAMPSPRSCPREMRSAPSRAWWLRSRNSRKSAKLWSSTTNRPTAPRGSCSGSPPNEPKLRVLDAGPLPPGWVGKNHAAWQGAQQATGDWLLFTDADAVHLPGFDGARPGRRANPSGAAMVSYSPAQEMHTWWERALIPFVFCRLSQLYSYAAVNDPRIARRGGQWPIPADPPRRLRTRSAAMRRCAARCWRTWRWRGGPKPPASAAFRARRCRSRASACTRVSAPCGRAGRRICFPWSPGPARRVTRELFSVIPWIPLLCLLLAPLHLAFRGAGVLLLAGRHASYAALLRRNRFPRLRRRILSGWVWRLYVRRSAGLGLALRARQGHLEGTRIPGRIRRVTIRKARHGSAEDAKSHGLSDTQDRVFSRRTCYHNPAFSAEENRRIFGKCNNPNGHGHNYVLEVTVGGETDPATGMVLDLKELKEILEREVMERMDHRFLNYEVPELAGQIPTCENIAARDLEAARAQDYARQADARAAVGESRIFTSIATATEGAHEAGTDAPLRVRRLASPAQRAAERRGKSAHLRQVQQSLRPRPQLRRGSDGHGPARSGHRHDRAPRRTGSLRRAAK